jgi:hypothetical protein
MTTKLTDDEKIGLSEEEIKAFEESDEPEASSDEPTDDDDKDSKEKKEEVTDDKKADAVDEKSKAEEKTAKDEEKLADIENKQEGDFGDKAIADTETKPTEKPKAEEPKKEDVADIPAPPFVKLGIVEQAEINKLNEEVKNLRKQFDDGEIEHDVLMQKQREMDKVVLKNEMAQEINEQSRQGTWRWEQDRFFTDNPSFTENRVINAAFTTIVNQLIASKEADTMTDAQVLSKAKEIIEEGLGGGNGNDEKPLIAEEPDDKTKAKAIKEAKTGIADKDKIPVTLKDIPTAESHDEESKWDYLDKLEGAAYQAAIDKLSVAELEQYAIAR